MGQAERAGLLAGRQRTGGCNETEAQVNNRVCKRVLSMFEGGGDWDGVGVECGSSDKA